MCAFLPQRRSLYAPIAPVFRAARERLRRGETRRALACSGVVPLGLATALEAVLWSDTAGARAPRGTYERRTRKLVFSLKRNDALRGAAKGCEILNFQGSPYLSRLRFPTLVSRAHMVGTEVLISPQGLSKGGCVFLDTFAIAQTLES